MDQNKSQFLQFRSVLLIAGLLGVSFLLFSGMPRNSVYCTWFPSIDTRFSPGFSESGFQLIRKGMSKSDVVRLIGKPLYTYWGNGSWGQTRPFNGSEIWGFTEDGRCPVCDAAWLGREIWFNPQGKVVRVMASVNRD